MMKKQTVKLILIFISLLFLISGPVSASSKVSVLKASQFYKVLTPKKEFQSTQREILRTLSRRHYQKIKINNEFSSNLFDRYLSDLDPSRSYFFQKDIIEFEAYRYRFDDFIRNSQIEPAFKIFNRYQSRLVDRLVYLIDKLDNGLGDLHFDVDETLVSDRKNLPWPKDNAEMENLWRKRLKSSLLSLKLSGKTLKEAAEVLSKRYRNQLNRVKLTNSDDAFQIYMNSFTRLYDPHTAYFPPKVFEDFNINMSLSLEGIGAVLEMEDDYTRIVRLIPGGPADKSKQLNPDDKIVGVAQGLNGELVDVVGWRLDDVVRLIRGPKETIVRLKVIPGDTQDMHMTKIVRITRNKVTLEAQSAQKDVIEIKKNDKTYKFGHITVPTFYLDLQALQDNDADYKSTTNDVKKLISELTKEGIDGLIIDLRNNGGGSLKEADSLSGLFITKGPIVQVRNMNGSVEVLKDPNPKIFYAGPLAVMINRMSASASEIFAGAIQDYHRGLIVGGQSFGKGTIQSIIPLNTGQLKTTIAKFYRISGQSTQLKGVIPDIVFPGLADAEKVGERALPHALPWDTIDPVDHDDYHVSADIISDLVKKHDARIKTDPDFEYLVAISNYLKTQKDKKEIELNEAVRKQEWEKTQEYRLNLENKRRKAKNLKPLASIKDLENQDKKEDEIDETDTKPKEPDELVIETGNILYDYIALTGKRSENYSQKTF